MAGATRLSGRTATNPPHHSPRAFGGTRACPALLGWSPSDIAPLVLVTKHQQIHTRSIDHVSAYAACTAGRRSGDRQRGPNIQLPHTDSANAPTRDWPPQPSAACPAASRPEAWPARRCDVGRRGLRTDAHRVAVRPSLFVAGDEHAPPVGVADRVSNTVSTGCRLPRCRHGRADG